VIRPTKRFGIPLPQFFHVGTLYLNQKTADHHPPSAIPRRAPMRRDGVDGTTPLSHVISLSILFHQFSDK
jgi:hypothetical protein